MSGNGPDRWQAPVRRIEIFSGYDMKKHPADRSAIAAWILHWSTALLVLMAFAMPFAQSFSQYSRRPIHFWHELHITVGTGALILALIRLAVVWKRRHRLFTKSSGPSPGAILQLILLAMIVATAFFGLLAFGQPVLGAKMKFLGLWTFPELRSLLSVRGGQFRAFHWFLSYGFLVILAIHIWIGIRRDPGRRERLIWTKIWPW
jgi:cytochrome b561